MVLYYSIVFGLLIFEMTLFGLMVFPFPKKWKRAALMKIDESGIIRRNQYIINIVGFFVFILFIDSVNRMIRATEEVNQANLADPRTDTQLHVKKFYSQRNMYLTGFTLFLSLIINRTFAILMDLFYVQEELEKFGEHSPVEHKDVKFYQESNDKQEKQIAELLKELDDLKRKDRDFELLKKQADNQSTEYNRLADQHNDLEKIREGRAEESKKEI
ncbi:B-cell receptor-associated 31-like protein [Basidiobolus meristosporus CBS 931.73]|uniref:Endoplasmic reticulum transmembrane protein n=1 Tax=Basidiobolus meristosporus CBS 931.73 TaxID=1314790 RepID=A0A1Y1Y7V1_9FUNG|nr:B-cell receptor-associated 31-like protein [Basidiobolus meristosporus CBS 931.73]|eukprot:ORX94091.1 B-cell receptor-associated 31-like protein [Basidiobolus meristosporus CBS 931.73]